MENFNGVSEPNFKTSQILRRHVFLLVDDDQRTVKQVMVLLNQIGKLYKLEDIIWIHRADNEDDTNVHSIRCRVEFMSDSYMFYKKPKEGYEAVHKTNYFLKETLDDKKYEDFTWSFPNVFDKSDAGE